MDDFWNSEEYLKWEEFRKQEKSNNPEKECCHLTYDDINEKLRREKDANNKE